MNLPDHKTREGTEGLHFSAFAGEPEPLDKDPRRHREAHVRSFQS